MEAELAGLAGRLSMLADEEERLADSLRTQEVRLEQAEGSETLSRLRLRAASLSGTIRGLGLEWSRYALARHLLLEARGRFEKERQPGVIRAASALFSAITGGAWVGIAASLEDSSLRVLPPHGEPVSPEVLSRGTRNSSIWPCGSRISATTRRRPPHCRSSWTTCWSTLIPIAPCVRLKPSAIWLLRKKVRRGISFCTSLATRIWRTCSARPSPASGCMSWRGERSGKRNDGQWRFEVAVVLRDLSGIFSFVGCS
ncbi:MAG: ATP-binding protein [Bilophila wadsworthia]